MLNIHVNGCDNVWLVHRDGTKVRGEPSFDVELALRFDDQARIDVGPYMVGLAELFETAGGTIFEHSRALISMSRSPA